MSNIVSIINGEALTTSLAIAEGVGNEHKHVIRLIRDYLSDLKEFGRVSFENAPFETAGGTQQREYAMLNEQQATLLITYMRNNDIVRAFKKQLVKAFYEAMQSRSVPKSLAQALRLAADLEEAKEKAILERDEAIRTKALIGSKREATAMATAAAAIKRADKFAELAGDSKRFKQVKAIPWLLEVFAPSKGMYQQMGKLLGKISAELNYDVLKIEDSEYGQVKAYHVDVITEALCRIEYSDELLGKYRNSKEGEAA